MQSMKLRWRLVFAGVVLVHSSALAAQQVVPTRALRPPSEPLVRAIATYALPTKGPIAVATEMSTAAQVIAVRCGSIQPGYFEEFKNLNNSLLTQNNRLTLAPDEALGTLSANLNWPACVVVLPTSSGQHLTTTTTGSGTAGVLPVTVELIPNNGVTIEHLIMQLNQNVSPGDDKPDEIVWDPPRSALKGVLIAAAGSSCPSAHPPFDARQVAAYYGLARQRSGPKQLKRIQGDVRVLVFDNGFYGYNPYVTPQFSEAFPENYFSDWSSDRGTVGPAITVGQILYPWLDPAAIAPGPLSSHGTHVAGLVLGGPDFVTYRTAFNYPETNNNWLRLGVVNIANGNSALIEGSSGMLLSILQRIPGAKEGRIVNLSLSYNEDDDLQIGLDFKALTKFYNLDLFVVASGNDQEDVGHLSIYPAMLGGSRPNVITVGAHNDDNPVKLAEFSNRGSHVDISAPGCSIRSWTSMTNTEIFSGTSQAAPLVTFAAALLRSLDQNMYPGDIRHRILTSADIYDSDSNGDVRPNLKLNIPKALLLFDDYVRLKNGEVYIGRVANVYALRCTGDKIGSASYSGRKTSEIASYKADAKVPKLMLIDEPACNASISPTSVIVRPRLNMTISYRLDGFNISPDNRVITPDLDEVAEIVMRAPPAGYYQ